MFSELPTSGVDKLGCQDARATEFLCDGAKCLWVPTVEICRHPCGAYNFEITPRFLENLHTPDLHDIDHVE